MLGFRFRQIALSVMMVAGTSAGCGGDDGEDGTGSDGGTTVPDAGTKLPDAGTGTPTDSGTGVDSGVAGDSGAATASIAAGMTAVMSTKYMCATCHTGSAGALAGSIGPNLTPDNATGLGSWTTTQIAAAVLTGVDESGGQLCPTMPRGNTQGMTQVEADSIALYLKSLSPISSTAGTTTCP